MKVELLKLVIENFKGVKGFTLDLDGKNAKVSSENGVGKTSVYDAFIWCLFGKDSDGKKEFGLRPLDSDNNAVKGVVIVSEATLSLDGESHVFRKEHHEKNTKKQFKGYETLCWIDEVPKKIGEYNKYITELIPEDTFKMLTNLTEFNGKLHWQGRREVLMNLAGEIGTPAGFDDLLGELKGRTIDEMKSVLSEQKKRHTKARDEIGPRIDEIQLGLNEYAGSDTTELEKERKGIKADLDALSVKRTALTESQAERQSKLDGINDLKDSLADRERELKNDTSHIQDLLDEKTKLVADVAEKKAAVGIIQSNINTANNSIDAAKSNLSTVQIALGTTKEKYKAAKAAPVDNTCYACSQKLPADKLAEVETGRKDDLKSLGDEGKGHRDKVTELATRIDEITEDLKDLEIQLGFATNEFQESEKNRDSRFVEIAALIKDSPPKNPVEDEKWLEISRQIADAKLEVGEPVTDQLSTIETERTTFQDKLEDVNKALAQVDNMTKAKKRIADLEQEEKDLAQKLADIEKQLEDIANYNAEFSALIEKSVNGKFKHVKFKMFNKLLNGSLELCCEAMLNGVTYPDMSAGQKIFVGIDIVNVLSEHYGMSVPLFVDSAESLTLPIKANCQTVELHAVKGVKKLKVETK